MKDSTKVRYRLNMVEVPHYLLSKLWQEINDFENIVDAHFVDDNSIIIDYNGRFDRINKIKDRINAFYK